ncbi:hypothetical protein FQA39_LY13909 [Lamprigera yunnana]|nr:hypothetical protein FQA39_LY13909 [Lamprigera yunnana]
MRTKYKNEIWDKITVDLNYSNGQTVKDLWRKLRDCHRDALRQQKKFKSGDKAKKVKVWTYQKQIEFLVPHMANSNTSGSVESSQQDETENLSDNETIHSPSGETPADEQNEDASEEVDAENVQESSRQREEERKQKTDEKPDSLYQFFLSMYHDTKEMPHISQLRTKRKLFEAVQVEEDVIAVPRESAVLQQSNSTHSLSPQNSVELSSRATSSYSRYEQELQPMYLTQHNNPSMYTVQHHI